MFFSSTNKATFLASFATFSQTKLNLVDGTAIGDGTNDLFLVRIQDFVTSLIFLLSVFPEFMHVFDYYKAALQFTIVLVFIFC